MLKELIDRLKAKKQQLPNQTFYNETLKEEKNNFEIILSQENNFFKMKISDYISITDYVKRMKEIDYFGLNALVSNAILWNSREQKVNKGIFYVIVRGNRLYNILLNGNIIKIDERTKKDDITEERIVWLDTDNNDYSYVLHNHDNTGNTFYTRFFSKKGSILGKLDLSEDEFFEDISLVINNLESVEGINSILDINLLKKCILGDLGKDSNHKKL